MPLKRRKRPSGKSSQKENSTPPKKSQNHNTQKRSVPSKKHYGAKSQAASKSTKPPAKSSKTPPKSAKTPTKTPKKTSKLTQTPSPGKQLTMDLFKDKATSGISHFVNVWQTVITGRPSSLGKPQINLFLVARQIRVGVKAGPLRKKKKMNLEKNQD